MPHKLPTIEALRERPGPLILLLAALVMIGPFSIDMYLPAFPSIAATFGASPAALQQTLSIYLIAYAVMMLWHGVLADALGRRPMILVALTIYAIATLGCAIAGNIETLWLFRALQGVSAGVGLVIGRTVVRDVFQGAAAQKMMARTTQIFSIAPAIAPVVGGLLVGFSGWRAVFWGLLILVILLLIWCYRALPETLPPEARQSLHFGALCRSYRAVISRPEFILLALTSALNFGGFFIYIAGAPSFLIKLLGVSEQGFAWLFVPMILGIVSGSTIGGKLAGRISPERIITIGYLCMGAACVLNLSLCLFLPANVMWNVLPIMLYTTGTSMVTPNAFLFMLATFPTMRGLASSLQGFVQFSLAALISALLVPLIDTSLLTLAFGMITFAVAGAVAWIAYRKTRAPLAPGAF
ncbi:MAG: multidrug effflux MFS transporter [Proteobacteria bacterium]|nr:multidrug effflux MFS transporter [Pseudomonadota bacterium]MCL2308383.1 multidrug effflux MFS transporter [Pseudomonadota bacterium]